MYRYRNRGKRMKGASERERVCVCVCVCVCGIYTHLNMDVYMMACYVSLHFYPSLRFMHFPYNMHIVYIHPPPYNSLYSQFPLLTSTKRS